MSDADAPDDDFDDFGEGDGDDDFGDLEDIGDIELGDDDFDDFGVLEDGEMNLEEIDDGEDAWRFDDTKLDDLEDFLRQVFSLEPPPSVHTHRSVSKSRVNSPLTYCSSGRWRARTLHQRKLLLLLLHQEARSARQV